MAETDDVFNGKVAQKTPLTRADIADVLTSLGPAGENREQKIAKIKELCEVKNTGKNPAGNPIWESLDDFPEF